MSQRRSIPKSLEKDVLLASRRRCCLCFFLDQRDEVRKGQVAHLNHDPSDFRYENLVWLCLDHHDTYDSKTRLSKGFTVQEVRTYRNRLYKRNDPYASKRTRRSNASGQYTEITPLPPISQYEKVRKIFSNKLNYTATPWHFPLWQVANEPEFFAYKAGNRSDGVCLVERIDLPDGRIVIACIETAGNPGRSVSNCVEELCFQVCERFEIPADRLVWLEHYDYDEEQEWNMVTFAQRPPQGPFAGPHWSRMTPKLWNEMKLKPKKKLTRLRSDYRSKLTKLCPWPIEARLPTP
jgi:hypothetical protein